MNRATAFFLILLRLAIGWHLLFAGLEKFEPDYPGSEGYLRESTGPAAPYYHELMGEPLLERFAVRPLGPEAEPKTDKPQERFPPGLNREWEAYFSAFANYYDLSDEQRALARKKLDQEKAETVQWMEKGKKVVVLQAPSGTDAKVPATVQERVDAYKKKLDQVAHLMREKEKVDLTLLVGSAEPENRDLALAKADLAKLRRELQGDLNARTKEMKESLDTVLNDEQKTKGAVPGPYRPGWSEMGRMDWIDFTVRWGLVIVGACLLLGLFTRLASLGGAALLLSFYLAMPPLPGLPEMVRAEGYPFINKNIVEMLALLTIATTASGKWVGLDRVLSALWRRKSANHRAPESTEQT
jgi:uncharacterized membrane protein YphA (DoxX/SURF4 family)